jgi:hypothetical protein
MRMRLNHILLLFILVVAGNIDLHAQGAVWNEIMPLRSTRNDVEQKLGKPEESGWYKFRNETVRFQYAEYGCGEIQTCYCLVPRDTVIEISVYLLKKRNLKEFNLDLSKFEKISDSHLLVYDYYTSDEMGITYTVFRKSGTVASINYFPSQKIAPHWKNRKQENWCQGCG